MDLGLLDAMQEALLTQLALHAQQDTLELLHLAQPAHLLVLLALLLQLHAHLALELHLTRMLQMLAPLDQQLLLAQLISET